MDRRHHLLPGRRPWHRIRAACCGAALLGSACASATYVVQVTTEPATTKRPVFAITQQSDEPLYGLVVAPCGGGSVTWQIGTGGGAASQPTSITYGVPPDGFKTIAGPAALTPGRYCVYATGGGVGHFRIASDGSLAP